jgi:class 3 adenylate cyclase
MGKIKKQGKRSGKAKKPKGSAVAARKKGRKTDFGEEIGAGAVLLCDIVGYSKLSATIQAGAVRHLLNFLCDDPLLKPKDARIINGTGDGALICWPQVKRKVSCPEIMAFSERLISHMLSTPNKRIELRIGIHIGQFRRVFPKSSAVGFQVTGTGLNECARISSIGDAGNVVVSEDFIAHWKKSMDGDALAMNRFYPSEASPVTVYVKHNEPMRVRLYVHGPVTRRSPTKFLAIGGVTQRIFSVLAKIESSFIDKLLEYKDKPMIQGANKDNSNTKVRDELARKISMRVTVFLLSEEDSKSPKLVPTEYRYHRDPAWRYKSAIEYVVKQERPEGPLAQSVISGSPQVLHGLKVPRASIQPNASAELTREYLLQLDEAGIGRDKALMMKRPPRSIIGFPIVTNFPNDPLSNEPRVIHWGAICMDADDPLDEFSRDELTTVAESINKEFGTIIVDIFALA